MLMNGKSCLIPILCIIIIVVVVVLFFFNAVRCFKKETHHEEFCLQGILNTDGTSYIYYRDSE